MGYELYQQMLEEAMASADAQLDADASLPMLFVASDSFHKGVVGLVDFGVDFFTTNERTRQVEKWFSENRPDVTVKKVDFNLRSSRTCFSGINGAVLPR